jgi:uncharacterized SAM-binding protein YcdF (DUF218 family)
MRTAREKPITTHTLPAMFFLSKVLALITQPLIWVFVFLLIACLRPAPARVRWVIAALVVMCGMAWSPMSNYALRELENQYPEWAPTAAVEGYAGIIVLGGGTESGHVSQAHQLPQMNEAGERMTAAAALLLRHPQLHMIYTGGEGQLMGEGPSEAERARLFFESLGLQDERMHYESVSRNTYENAMLSAQLPGIQPQQRWLLVTSAWHMPRSMATFRKAGWNVTAYPVDYRTGQTLQWANFSFPNGATRWQMVLHEWLGLAMYRLTGRL